MLIIEHYCGEYIRVHTGFHGHTGCMHYLSRYFGFLILVNNTSQCTNSDLWEDFHARSKTLLFKIFVLFDPITPFVVIGYSLWDNQGFKGS